ncbi:MAG TPA: helix-turn-helix domain-containing protein [Solirubrobacterales bacterium]|nr:helix-turn-helix domain-containing protein [Solirubrobacterales bacterium]
MTEQLRLEVPDGLVELIAERAAELVVAELAAREGSPYLSVEEGAEYLRCKPKRIYDLTSQGRLPCAKDGSRTLLRRTDLDAYLEDSA